MRAKTSFYSKCPKSELVQYSECPKSERSVWETKQKMVRISDCSDFRCRDFKYSCKKFGFQTTSDIRMILFGFRTLSEIRTKLFRFQTQCLKSEHFSSVFQTVGTKPKFFVGFGPNCLKSEQKKFGLVPTV